MCTSKNYPRRLGAAFTIGCLISTLGCGESDENTDAATADAGAPDAGERDSGAVDAGPMDAGPPDAGPEDAGPMDAGPWWTCDDGVIEAPEVCEPRTSPCCAADCLGPAVADTVCRTAAHDCDAVEVCDGETFLCPDDALAEEGSDCNAEGATVCDPADECDGSGTCTPIVAEDRVSCTTCGGAACWCGGGSCVAARRNCAEILAADPSAEDGTYFIDGDGDGEEAPFEVYCDMTTDGGGWTLVDNDAVEGEVFTTRLAGANPDITVTRGSILPAYTWSDAPQLLCKSSHFTGTVGWVTFTAEDDQAQSYPTTATGISGEDLWTVGTLNGNTDRGRDSFIFNTGVGNFGAVWIGGNTHPTCTCNYSNWTDTQWTGLGSYVAGNVATCSTWVR